MLAFEVLIKEVIQLLLLNLGQGVNLCTEHLRVWDKFYGMVPFFPIWEFMEGFFGKELLELLVGFGLSSKHVKWVSPAASASLWFE